MPIRPLNIDADLHLQVGTEDVRIRGEGSRLVVALPNVKAGALLMKSNPFKTNRRARLRSLNLWLQRVGLTVDVQLAGRPWIRIGTGTRPGALSRLLRLQDVDIRPGPSVRALASDRRTWPGLALGLGGLLTLAFVLHRKK